MSWQEQLKGDPLAWLLAPDSPGVRYLALRDLLDVPGDNSGLRAAAQAAHTEDPIAALLDRGITRHNAKHSATGLRFPHVEAGAVKMPIEKKQRCHG